MSEVEGAVNEVVIGDGNPFAVGDEVLLFGIAIAVGSGSDDMIISQMEVLVDIFVIFSPISLIGWAELAIFGMRGKKVNV